jgi:hypothetical protein
MNHEGTETQRGQTKSSSSGDAIAGYTKKANRICFLCVSASLRFN